VSRSLPILVLGAVLGGAVVALLFVVLDPGSGRDDGRIRELEKRVAELSRDLDAARDRHEESSRIAAANLPSAFEDLVDEPPPPAEIPPIEEETEPIEDPVIADTPAATGLSDPELEQALRGLGPKLQGLMFGTSDDFRKAVQDILARGGPGTVDRILEAYRSEQDLGAKAVLAHALAQTDDPEAIAALEDIARSADAGLFDRRTATHGLAFSDREDLVDFYREIARNPQIEIGARANSAYGLARRQDEGIELYGSIVDEAFAKKDAFALAYLSGFQILGKRAVPAVEKRLATIHEPQARLVMVGLLAENGSASSIPALRALAAEPGVSQELRKQANGAIERIESRTGSGD
jgi:hypothetical protein